MSFASTSPDGLTINPRNGDGTGRVDISGTIMADLVYAPGTIVRMAHYRQEYTYVDINGIRIFPQYDSIQQTFIPLKIDTSSTIICEAHFSYFVPNNSYITNHRICLYSSAAKTWSIMDVSDSCNIRQNSTSNNLSGYSAREHGRPLIIQKDIPPNTNDDFTVGLLNLSTDGATIQYEGDNTTTKKFSFIFFQIAQ